MGDVVPFRDRRKWTRPEDYGHVPDGGVGGGSGGDGRRNRDPQRPRRRKSAGFRALLPLGFWSAAVAGLSLWVAADPVLLEPPSWLASEPETVTATFTICGQGRASHCVVDGDTFRIGDRKIRIIGIDTPEIHPARCAAEAKLGAEAATQLQRLLNAGPFTMTARLDEPEDKYGRELRALSRTGPQGENISIAREMIASGKARRYAGEFRKGWC